MADDTDDQYLGHQSGQLNPMFQQFLDGFDSDNGRAWAATAVAKLQQHFTMRAVAEQNNAAGEAFVQNLHDFKQNFADIARKDPTATGTLLDLVDHTVGHMAVEHGQNMNPDAASGALSTVADHIKGEIAHASVQSLAEKDEGLARSAMASPRISALLGDDQKSALDQYITSQAAYRQHDAIAALAQTNRNAAYAGYQKATGYLSSLSDQTTGEPQFPPGFGAQVMRDTGIGPNTAAAFMQAIQI